MARLDLLLLGALEIKPDDTLVTDPASRRARALLAYPAIEAGRSHPRNALAGRYPL